MYNVGLKNSSLFWEREMCIVWPSLRFPGLEGEAQWVDNTASWCSFADDSSSLGNCSPVLCILPYKP